MLHVQALWLALGPSDMRAGMDTLLGQVVRRFGAVQPHHAYIFSNRNATRLKVLLHDGAGLWLCARRLHAGHFIWPRDANQEVQISAQQFTWLVAGAPWQHLEARAIEHV